MATHDAVTGLWNRRQFMTMAEHEFARQRRAPATLTIVAINVHVADSSGASQTSRIGDADLVQAAHALKTNCRTIDIVARWDATEFLALVSCASLPEAALFAERVGTAVEEAILHRSPGANYIVSTGLTEVHLGEDFFTALARVDAAAEDSKQARLQSMHRYGPGSLDAHGDSLAATSRN
jgi:diguanylate cyclase (GGDEF)-like protein